MNNIRLCELHIRNFKGIEKFDIDSIDGDLSIYGTNASGKTTVFDSVSWLLFGKDSLNSAQFEIKPLDESGAVKDSGTETEISAIFLGDKTIELKKVYFEKWVKRRGEANKEFTGHTTNHFINDVPVKEKEFKAAVADICPDNLFLLLTNPRHFNTTLKWEDRRRSLLDISGDVTDEDVIASDPELADLPGILGSHSTDDYKKIVKSRLTKINDEIKGIPIRISEVKRSMLPDLRSEKTVKGALVVQEEIKKDLAVKLFQIENGGEIAAKTKEVAEVEAKIIRLDNQAANELSKLKEAYRDKREIFETAARKAAKEYDAARREESDLAEDREVACQAIENLETEVAALREEWHEENKKVFEYDTEKSWCPTCGQTLPEDQIEAARTKALESFNAVKAQLLHEINNRGKKIKDNLDKQIVRRDTVIEALAAMAEKVALLEKESEDAMAMLESYGPFVEENPDNPERVALVDKKAKLESDIEKIQAGAKGSIDEVKAEIDAVDELIKSLDQELLKIEAAGTAKKRMEDLGKEERKLAAEYEKLEGHLFLIEKFIRAKVSMLTEKINSKFSLVRFMLFKEQINGGLQECCIATVNGVPYDSMNNGARINCGLDIINALSQHHGIALPVFVDNAESIVDIMPTMAQQIRLVVSQEDQTLRIERG